MKQLNDSQSMHAEVARDIKVTYDITNFNHKQLLLFFCGYGSIVLSQIIKGS